MGDLISRKDIFPNGVFIVNNGDPMKSLDELINRIWQIEAVDAVEVVRCKDCKKYQPETKDWIAHCTFTGIQTNTDDFCSYGERRSND